MNKILLITSTFVLLTGHCFASNCKPQALAAFQKSNPANKVREVSYKGVLKPGAETIYHQREIWNSTQSPLDIYEIKSSYMGTFIHVALVNKVNCQVQNLIEISFK